MSKLKDAASDTAYGLLGCLGALVGLAFFAACALVAIAAVVWAYRYLFGS